MRILVLTPEYPYPPSTGTSLIAYHHIRHLATRHPTDLLALSSREVPDEGDLAEVCRTVRIIALPARTIRSRARGLWDRRPWQVIRFDNAAMHAAVHQALTTTEYDVVLVQHEPMAQFIPPSYAGPIVWNLEDPPVLKNRRWLPYEPVLSRMRTRERLRRLERYEHAVAPRFDRVLLINEADADDYAAVLPGARVDWVPYGVDIGAAPSHDARERTPGMIIITGNMNHPPNVEAVLSFCRQVYPGVRTRAPHVQLWLVGANPTHEVTALAADASIHVTGRVDDVREYLQRAMVSVCAVSLRIGTQTKVLEAMACGTPVVTTTAGNHGVRAVSGVHLYVADRPDEMASRVAALANGEQWTAMSTAARRFVEDEFTWERSGTRLEMILREVVSARTNMPAS